VTKRGEAKIRKPHVPTGGDISTGKERLGKKGVGNGRKLSLEGAENSFQLTVATHEKEETKKNGEKTGRGGKFLRGLSL